MQKLTTAACVADHRSAAVERADSSGRVPNPQRDMSPRAGGDERLVIAMFEQQVASTPNRVALMSGDVALTYEAVKDAADRLVEILIAEGVGPERVVAVALSRSVHACVVPLAILKAGGAYMPLDVTLPRQRLATMFDDAKPALVILDAHAREHVTVNCRRFDIERLETKQARAAAAAVNASRGVRQDIDPRNAAYIIYTSGSTGRPKAVVVEHAALTSLLCALSSDLGFDASHRHLALTATAFDVSVAELLLPLCVGASIVIADRDEVRDAASVRALVTDSGATSIVGTPSHWAELVDVDGEAFAGRRIVSTGEALPACLAKRLLELGRETWNLYGPTEATVWATAHRVSGTDLPADGAGTVSIGSPLSHCTVAVLDDDGNAVPPGAAGELYIGGTAVARGYLHRPALTAARFVPNPTGSPGGVLYRTGDRVCSRDDGTLDFLGRTDRQVKIRGFRIELAEVEAALARDPRVESAVVTVESDGDRRLVGYVVPRQDGNRADAAIEAWRELHESVYGETTAEYQPDFNIAGWVSSYTGRPMPPEQVRLWVNETVDRIRAFGARRMLEVGCGTGLLLTRLAPGADRYIGVDFSEEAIAQLRVYLGSRGDLAHVEVAQKAAHELSFLADDAVDLVIINSVVQYFPNVEYMVDVLDQAARVTRPGGHVFVGDVRSLPLLDAFHASVQLHQADGGTPIGELRRRVADAVRREEQLLIDPAFFAELASRHDKLGRVALELKRGTYENENSLFRCDVVLAVGAREVVDEGHCLSWDRSGQWRADIQAFLASRRDASVVVRGVPDSRVGPAVVAARAIRDDAESSTAWLLRARCSHVEGEHPHAIDSLAKEFGVDIVWRCAASPGIYDVIFNPRWSRAARQVAAPPAYYRRYTNARVDPDGALGTDLRRTLRDALPDHMVPAAVVVLDAWPLTASGKRDLQLLPRPTRPARTDVRLPRSSTERALCDIIADVLGVDSVGIDDDFFELGGHSLLATRLLNRLRSTLGAHVPLRTLFESRSVATLAERLQARV